MEIVRGSQREKLNYGKGDTKEKVEWGMKKV